MNLALGEGNYEPVEVWAPFIKMTKAKIVEIGEKLHVPFGDTWSCYDPVTGKFAEAREDATWKHHNGTIHCGVCGTCRERKNAFSSAGVDDPTVYAK